LKVECEEREENWGRLRGGGGITREEIKSRAFAQKKPLDWTGRRHGKGEKDKTRRQDRAKTRLRAQKLRWRWALLSDWLPLRSERGAVGCAFHAAWPPLQSQYEVVLYSVRSKVWSILHFVPYRRNIKIGPPSY
jgi:hypothetical protein